MELEATQFNLYCPEYNDFFRYALHFPIFLASFDQRTIRFGLYKKKSVSNIHKTGIKDRTVCPILSF